MDGGKVSYPDRVRERVSQSESEHRGGEREEVEEEEER